ncbi:MAG: hypothetical protein QNJ60_05785 [Xenococcaceae cyanobacterium MO_188.B19]|nr:hypothetical protein [Xenococcaceae cyanobacterium MO_188.B19]
MKIQSLILASVLAIPTTLAVNLESASAIIQRPIGRFYALPASPSVSLRAESRIIAQRPIGRAYSLPVTPSALPAFDQDSNGDSIIDLSITQIPQPRFEFSILTEQNGQPIVDLDSSPVIGFFPNAISSFAYIEDIEETSRRLQDAQGNFLPSTQEEEVIQQIIPDDNPTSFFDGDLNVELVNSATGFNLPGILYEFTFGGDVGDFIQFLLPTSSFPNDFDSFLAINDISYIVNQTLLGQEGLIEELRLVASSFRVNAAVNDTIFAGNQPESAIIFASEPVTEPNNIIGLLTMGLLVTKLSKKYKVKKK